MPYRDTLATCEECGGEFIFTVEEQRRLDAMGSEIRPSVCPDCREEATVAPGPHHGTVKWFDAEKGYGFISQSSGQEVFFHRSGIAVGDPHRFTDGALVTFEVEGTDRGPQAVNVTLAESTDE